MAATSGAYTIRTAGHAWDIAHAAATDAANRHTRMAGRKRWTAADQDFHTDEVYRQLINFGFWRDGAPTPLYFAMRADKNAPFVIETRPLPKR